MFAILLWLGAAWPLLLFLLYQRDPLAPGRLAQSLGGLAGPAAWIAGLLFAAALLLYPPFLPWLRVGLRGLRGQLRQSQLPLLEAQRRLQGFDNPADRLLLGRLHLDRGEVQAAIGHLLVALQLEPGNVATRYELGRALLRAGRVRDAAELLGQVVSTEESYAFGEALLRLGDAQLRAGEPTLARATLERHRALYGGRKEALLLLATACERTGDRAAALAVLGAAAAPPAEGRLGAEDALHRARARVRLWFARRQ